MFSTADSHQLYIFTFVGVKLVCYEHDDSGNRADDGPQ